MSSVFVRVLRAGPDLPAAGPEPYIRITAFALDDLGLTFEDLETIKPRLSFAGTVFNATWELYTIEPDTGPIFRLTPAGLSLTGLVAGRIYVARYDPNSQMVIITRAVSGK